ncbi:MAG: hypothetical protein IMY72_11775 [Bacteroidetes bacterium]|nr:hypothetical protein [Bacteroidota bacterium]
MGSSGIAMSGVYREVWTGAVKEELSTLQNATFLEGIEDYSRYVSSAGDEMQVIHLVYMGVLPEVLINNTTYPIPEQVLGEEDIPIPLDKYQTKPTPITDDELYALSYDKIATVKGKHTKAINISKFQKAIHAIAPANSSNSKMPVLLTTGEDDGTGRKRLVIADILSLKKKADALQIPYEGRRLVLCEDHINDLLLVYQNFKDQYYNYTSGKIANLFSFAVFEYSGNPYYNATRKVKLAFGAVPEAGDQKASIFFSMERVVRANGWTKMYYSEAKTDPANQRNLVNFRHNALVLPTQEDGRGAIISANV